MKNVLIACEESQRVCKAFLEREFNAFSCDIQKPSGDRLDRHILGDVVPLLNGNCTFETMDGEEHTIEGKWDLIIAHPPCTYLSNAGARFLYPKGVLNIDRYFMGIAAKEFFMNFINADCEHIAVENPTPSKVFGLPIYTQIIQPYYFGDPFKKKTCLWLRNLPKLMPTNICENAQSTKVTGNWYNKGGKERKKNRAKTFQGIANAMAEQWGDYING